MKFITRSLILLAACAAIFNVSAHSQQINPNEDIRWSAATGCGTANQPFVPASGTCVVMGTVTGVSVTTANGVSATSSGGATPALTFSLGAITPTSTNGVSAATMAFMDATSSVQTQLNAKGVGNTTSTSLTTNSLPKANGANSLINSLYTDSGTLGTYTGTGGFQTTAGPIGAAAPSGDAGLLYLVGNTVNQTCPTNDFCIFGFNSASATAYGWQPNATAPSGTQFMTAGTPVSGASPVNYVSSTGSGNVVLATSPTLVTPNLGTPSALTLTSATGLPISTGVTGLGTNVAATLAINTGSTGAFGVLIKAGSVAMNTALVTSGSCETVVTVAAAGVLTSDVITLGFNTDPTAITGYGASATGAVLTIYPYPTAGNVNFKVCNSTTASITPGALTINWRVER